MSNPFPITHYTGPRNFCDRNTELSTLIEAFDNQRPVLLSAIRRIGKTGLIHHFQHHLDKKRDTYTVYVDIMDTLSDADFASKLIQACISTIEKKQDGFISRLTKYFSKLKPTLTFDPFTGVPEIELDIRSDKEVRMSLSVLAEMLGKLKRPIQISIDEFQQISNYKHTVIDASLRSYFHKMKNVHFLFSGSQRSLLLALFTDSKKPMFGSVQQVSITHIEQKVYHQFIKKKFNQKKIEITDEAIDEILDWTNTHTFYTQYCCNRIFSQGHKKITEREVAYIKRTIFHEYENTFINYRQLLSPNQWKLMKGIAQEGHVSALHASFLQQYNLAESSARQALKALLEKEMIYEELDIETNNYRVYDQFLSRWMAR